MTQLSWKSKWKDCKSECDVFLLKLDVIAGQSVFSRFFGSRDVQLQLQLKMVDLLLFHWAQTNFLMHTPATSSFVASGFWRTGSWVRPTPLQLITFSAVWHSAAGHVMLEFVSVWLLGASVASSSSASSSSSPSPSSSSSSSSCSTHTHT